MYQNYYTYYCPYAIPPYQFIPNQFNYRDTPRYANPLPDYVYMNLKDYGPTPFATNTTQAAQQNDAFRTTLWTGKHLQVTLMSINVGEDIGFEIHDHLDQFISIEEGRGIVMMGDSSNQMNVQSYVEEGYAFIVPAGSWHNLINTGNIPLKLISIYAPPQHPHGTVHKTRSEAMAAML